MEIEIDETISVTDIQRKPNEIFEKIGNGDHEKLVIFRNNKIAGVLLNPYYYEALIRERENLRLEKMVSEREASFDPQKALSHSEMLNIFMSECTGDEE